MSVTIYISNSIQVCNKIASLLDATRQADWLWQNGESQYIALIEGYSEVSINGTGRYLHVFYEGQQQMKACLEYLSLLDIKNINSILKNNKISHVVNACAATPYGQYAFETLAAITGITSEKYSVSRLWLNSLNITPEDLVSQRMPNENFRNFYTAVLCEKILDRYWLQKSDELFGQKLNLNYRELYALCLIRDREIVISEQKHGATCQVYITLRAVDPLEGDIIWKFKVNNKQIETINSQEEIKAVTDQIKDKTVMITNISKTKGSTPHPLLYNTADLIKEAKTLKIGSSEEIKIAVQNLYNKGYITNPSTTSNHITRQYMKEKSASILRKLLQVPEYSKYITFIQQRGNITFGRACNDELASISMAIVPTDRIPERPDLSEKEFALYNLIMRRFLSIFLGDTQRLTIVATGIIDQMNTVKLEETYEFYDGWRLLDVPYRELESYIKTVYSNEYLDKLMNSVKFEKTEIYPIGQIILETSTTKNKLRYSVPSLINHLNTCGKSARSENKKILYRHLGMGVEENKSDCVVKMINNKLIVIEEERVTLTSKSEEILKRAPKLLVIQENLYKLNSDVKELLTGNSVIKTVIYQHVTFINRCIEMRKLHLATKDIDYDAILNQYVCPYCYSQLLNDEKEVRCCGCYLVIPKEMYNYTLQEKDFHQLFKEGITDIITGLTFKNGRPGAGKGRLRLDYVLKRPKPFFD